MASAAAQADRFHRMRPCTLRSSCWASSSP